MYRLPILELLQDSEDPPATPESLEELELELGARFPKEYSDFLLQFNGGSFQRPVMFYLPNPTKWITEVGVNAFFGDPSDRQIGEAIATYAEMFEQRIPDGFLPIASCGGDLVLLAAAVPTPEFGKVWFWDQAGEIEGDNVYWVADSFVEFLSVLEYDLKNDDEECETVPIFQAIEQGNSKAVERLLAEGTAVESRNASGQTLLAAAAFHSWPKIVRLLLDRGADPNARDDQGRTPLHHAAGHSIDSAKLLLAAGADAKARDNAGKSVLAEWSYRLDQILLAHGAEE